MAGRPVPVVLFAAVLVCLPVFAEKPPQVLETTELTADAPLELAIPEGSKLEVKGVMGEIDVVPAEGEATVVEITRPDGGNEPRLVLLRHEQGYTLCSVHASPNPKKPNECVPGKKGRMRQGLRKDWPRVHFVVRLPESVDFMGMMWGDRMSARAGRSNLDLNLDIGELFIHDAGSKSIDAKAYGANIKAVLSDVVLLPEMRGARLETLGGNIDVTVPAALPIHYWVYSDQPVRSAFKLEPKSAGVLQGKAGPPGKKTAIHILLETALLGKVTIRRP